MKTLTNQQWQMVFSLPADGKDYRIEGVAWRAKHIPQTSMKIEQVVVDSGAIGIVRRRLVKGKWAETEFISTY